MKLNFRTLSSILVMLSVAALAFAMGYFFWGAMIILLYDCGKLVSRWAEKEWP